MPKVTIKKSRTKSYEEKLRERQERMNAFEQPETASFMPGEDLSDNEDDDDRPLEVATKKEVLPLLEEDEPQLPDVELKPRPKKKKKKLAKVSHDEYAVTVDDSVQLKLKVQNARPKVIKNRMSFREKLLMANTAHLRHPANVKSTDSFKKWATRTNIG